MRVWVCVYVLCKYESRYGYMLVCIHISVDFYNLLWVPVGRSVRVVSVMFLCNVSSSL